MSKSFPFHASQALKVLWWNVEFAAVSKVQSAGERQNMKKKKWCKQKQGKNFGKF